MLIASGEKLPTAGATARQQNVGECGGGQRLPLKDAADDASGAGVATLAHLGCGAPTGGVGSPTGGAAVETTPRCRRPHPPVGVGVGYE